MAVAMIIAIPVGIGSGTPGGSPRSSINVANVGRALPSLAVMGLVLPITVCSTRSSASCVYPTLVAMVVLAVPPILVNTREGIAGVDRDIVEAARAMGMTEAQVVRRVELPLALPAILVGLRSAAVQVVATATLGAIFGAGGLGRYLSRASPRASAAPG